VGNLEGKRPLGRPRYRWEDGIRMDLRETGWGCRVDLSDLGQGPVAGCCEHCDKPLGSGATELVAPIFVQNEQLRKVDMKTHGFPVPG
jgi:hypothetical protein